MLKRPPYPCLYWKEVKPTVKKHIIAEDNTTYSTDNLGLVIKLDVSNTQTFIFCEYFTSCGSLYHMCVETVRWSFMLLQLLLRDTMYNLKHTTADL